MKKGSRGIIERVLNGVAFIGLGLSLLISEGFASSDVYSVRPDSAGNSGWANTVWESFSATCDSIDSVSFFVGAEVPHKIYTAQVYDSITQQVVWSTTRSSTGWKYQDMGFGVRKPVVRGKKYCLQLSIADSSFLPLQWNYYYRNGNPYTWGVMGGFGTGKDLAARVIGSGRVLDVWGMCTYMVSSQNNSTFMESRLTTCRSESVDFIREYFPWRFIQPTSDSFKWGWSDTMMIKAAAESLKVLGNLADGANWCASQPPNDTCIKSDMFPYQHPPKNLYEPVFDMFGNINPANYWGHYVYRTVKRYGNGSDTAKHNAGNPIQYWEIWNEENSITAWDWPYKYDYQNVYPGGVANIDSLISLYKRLVVVADSAIRAPGRGADPQAKLVMGGLERVRVSGNQRDSCTHQDAPGHPYPGVWWLDKFLGYSGGQYIDVYAFHPYQEACWLPGRATVGELQKDVDTLRQVMKARGQGDKPLWANEVGWAAMRASGISEQKKADNYVRLHGGAIEQGTNPRGPLDKIMWYELLDYWSWNGPKSDTIDFWYGFCGAVDSSGTLLPIHYAIKQMTTKLKRLYFNRRVPLADTNAYAYEFQTTDTGLAIRKTWVVWRKDTLKVESLSVKTTASDSIMITYDGNETSRPIQIQSNGKIFIEVDSMPVYVRETGTISRPDIIVDSTWIYPSNPGPRAGEGVWFYARLKNVGNASLSSSIWNSVTFQVDGVSKKTYQIQRTLNPGDTVTLGATPPGGGSSDWTATWGDHLIRAWADSADRYVELREDNNQGYIFKHIRPKVSLIINSGTKYSNHLSNNVVSVVINGNTSPSPDSTYIRHESGSWTKIPKTTSFDTSVTYSGNGVFSDSVLIFQGADTALAGDSIIVDASAPYTAITSPPDSQTVALNAQVEFWGFSYDFEYHDSLWQIWENSFAWAEGGTRVGFLGMFWVPGYFGTWTAWSTAWHTHTLISRDSATNIDTTVVHVYVIDSGGGNDGFGAGFGTFSSAPMNVVTDPNGNLFVAETQNSKVRKYSPKKDSLFAFSARRNDSTGLNWAVGMVLKDSTILYVADGYGHAIKAFDKQGNLLLRFGSFGTDTTQFKQPCGIALDGKGRIWVVDRLNSRVQVFDSTGRFLFKFGTKGSDSTQFDSPTGIAITPNGLVWITDTKNQRVQVYDSLGNWKKIIMKPDSLGFDTPTGICTDKHGNIFIADTKHNRIVELNPFGKRLFIFGKEGDSLCQFKNPIGVTSSPGGHYLYVADMGNKRVTRFWVIRGDTLGGGGPQSKDAVRLPPKVTYLSQSYPNPATGNSVIEYGLAKESEVRLVMYNVAGQVVREYNPGKQKAWYYSIKWDGRSNLGHRVGAGVYFYRLQAGNWAKTRKMVVIR